MLTRLKTGFNDACLAYVTIRRSDSLHSCGYLVVASVLRRSHNLMSTRLHRAAMSYISHVSEQGGGLRQKGAAGSQQALAVGAAAALARAMATWGARAPIPGLLAYLLETKLVLSLPFCSGTKKLITHSGTINPLIPQSHYKITKKEIRIAR